MNVEFSSFASAANNPFAALMSPELVMAAHERMSSRAAGVVHRPLDKPRIVKAGQEALAALDAEVDEEGFDEFDTADDVDGGFCNLVTAASRDLVRLPL